MKTLFNPSDTYIHIQPSVIQDLMATISLPSTFDIAQVRKLIVVGVQSSSCLPLKGTTEIAFVLQTKLSVEGNELPVYLLCSLAKVINPVDREDQLVVRGFMSKDQVEALLRPREMVSKAIRARSNTGLGNAGYLARERIVLGEAFNLVANLQSGGLSLHDWDLNKMERRFIRALLKRLAWVDQKLATATPERTGAPGFLREERAAICWTIGTLLDVAGLRPQASSEAVDA